MNGSMGQKYHQNESKKNNNYVLMDIKKIREQKNAPAQLNYICYVASYPPL